MTPLCAELYSRLEEVFGSVLIAKPGQPLRREQTRGRTRLGRVIDWGEQYRVPCPICREKRYRLYINHQFSSDQSLARCFNEDCFNSQRSRQQLHLLLFKTTRPGNLIIREGASIDTERDEPVQLPQPFLPLSWLGESHPACQYLLSRQFDPFLVSKEQHVGFCDNSAPEHRLAHNRLIIPVFMEGQLQGWTARTVYREEPK